MGMAVTETRGASAAMPANMEPSIPPQGTKLYDVSRNTHSFGVYQIAVGAIRTFAESSLEPTEYTEGTFIAYQPGTMYAHVARRGLSADEINRIGDIGAEVDTDGFKLTFLPQVIEQTTKLRQNLRVLGVSRRTSEEAAVELDSETQETIKTLGVLLDRLEQQKTAVHEDYDRLLREADQLGVVVFESHTGSNSRGEKTVVPVKLYINGKDKPQSGKTTNP